MEKDVHAGSRTQLAADTVWLLRVWYQNEDCCIHFTPAFSLILFCRNYPCFLQAYLTKPYQAQHKNCQSLEIYKSTNHLFILENRYLKSQTKSKQPWLPQSYTVICFSQCLQQSSELYGSDMQRKYSPPTHTLSRQRRKNSASSLFLSGSLQSAETANDIRIVVAKVNPKLRLAV